MRLLRVVQAVEQVDRAGPDGAHAHRETPRQLRLRGCGERARLLVAHTDPLDAVLTPDGVDHGVERVTDHTPELADAVLGERFDDHLGDRHLGSDVHASPRSAGVITSGRAWGTNAGRPRPTRAPSTSSSSSPPRRHHRRRLLDGGLLMLAMIDPSRGNDVSSSSWQVRSSSTMPLSTFTADSGGASAAPAKTSTG